MHARPIHRSLIAALGVTAACAPRTTSTASQLATRDAVVTGSLAPSRSFALDAGVSRVRVVMEARDSIAWVFETSPPGCATPSISPDRLTTDHRDGHCSTTWDIHMPPIEDTRLRVSVGDIDVTAPADRAVQLHSNVGHVRLRLDGRELRHDRSPGSGDNLELGDLGTLPRLEARAGVGSVRAELRAVAQSSSPPR